MKILILASMLLVVSPAYGQEMNPFAWPSEKRPIAEALSNVSVVTALGLDTLHSWRSNDKKSAFSCQALRMGVTIGVTSAAKLLVHRDRPDHSNDHSFFSGHTANAMASSGWRFQVGIPLATGTGYLRAAANKHYLTDVAVGAGMGFLATRLCKGD